MGRHGDTAMVSGENLFNLHANFCNLEHSDDLNGPLHPTTGGILLTDIYFRTGLL